MFVLIGFEDPGTADRLEDGLRRLAPEANFVASTSAAALRGGPTFARLPDLVVLEVPAFQRADLGPFYDTLQRNGIPLFLLADPDGSSVDPHELRGATLVLDRDQALEDVEGLTVAMMEYVDTVRGSPPE